MAGLWTYPIIKAFELLKLSDWNVENRQNVVLNNVDYLWKTINPTVLSDNISKVVPSVTIKDANAAAICACVAELKI